MTGIEKVRLQVKQAQALFRDGLLAIEDAGGLTRERYIRFLQMQYHLTRGVQRPFLTVAAHRDMGKKRGLRKFLVQFANEEEFHFEVAGKDLRELQEEPGECPFDVALWWRFFTPTLEERPFLRLGATCILENLGAGSPEVIDRLMKKADYLTAKNTVFFRIHQHGDALPHGDQIFEALETANLEQQHWDDVLEGAQVATLLYLRMMHWVFHGKSTLGLFDLSRV
jgi:hypothetical protein